MPPNRPVYQDGTVAKAPRTYVSTEVSRPRRSSRDGFLTLHPSECYPPPLLPEVRFSAFVTTARILLSPGGAPGTGSIAPNRHGSVERP
jgi:hypothetical protein